MDAEKEGKDKMADEYNGEYTNNVHNNDKFSQYEQVFERVNLQSIGHFLKEGEEILKIDKKTLSEREQEADSKLREELSAIFDKETVEKLLEIISCYTMIKEEIQFSLGMKIGARMLQLLTDDIDRDF